MIGSRLTEDQYYELLKAAGKQKNEEVLNSVIRHALNSKKMHALSIINSSLQLMHLGHAENALKVLLQFSNTLLTRKEPLGAFFIRELHSANIEMVIFCYSEFNSNVKFSELKFSDFIL